MTEAVRLAARMALLTFLVSNMLAGAGPSLTGEIAECNPTHG
jgi:hypothetical protein